MKPPTRAGPAVVVMGVTGAGKTTVAAELSVRLGHVCLDADVLHPAANIAKMRSGVPLTDADRAPWLDAVAHWIDANPHSVIACSALRRRYRDRLRAAKTPLWFAHLDPPPDVLRDRLRNRAGHFMPASLLPDQLATLEPLDRDEAGAAFHHVGDPARIADAILTSIPGRLTVPS
jgi:gluconokinase